MCSTAKSPRQHTNRWTACSQWAVCRRSTSRNRRGSHGKLPNVLGHISSNTLPQHYVPHKGERRRQPTSDTACEVSPNHHANTRTRAPRVLGGRFAAAPPRGTSAALETRKLTNSDVTFRVRFRRTMCPTRASYGANRRPTRRVKHRQVTAPKHECTVGGLPPLHGAVQARLSRHGNWRTRTLPFECGFAAPCAQQGRATAPIDVRRGVKRRQVTMPIHEPRRRVWSVGGLTPLHGAKQARL